MGESGVKNVYSYSINVGELSKDQQAVSTKFMSLITIEQFDEPEIMPSTVDVPLAKPTIHFEGLEKDANNIIGTRGFIRSKDSDNLRMRGKLTSLPLQDVKRISLDSKIPNIVNTEASPKLSLVSDRDEAERSPDRCPSIAKITDNKKKSYTDALAQIGNSSAVRRALAQDAGDDRVASTVFGKFVKQKSLQNERPKFSGVTIEDLSNKSQRSDNSNG